MTAPAAPHQDLLVHDRTGSLPPALARSLQPGPPRRAAAVLLLLAAAAGFVAWLVLGRLLGVDRAGAGPTASFVVQGLVPVAALVCAAAFALTGSPAARLLGSVVAVAAMAVPLSFVQQWWSVSGTELGLDDLDLVAPFVAVVVLHLAAVPALLRPDPLRR